MIRLKALLDTEMLAKIAQLQKVAPDEVGTLVGRGLRPFVSQEVSRRLKRPPAQGEFKRPWTSIRQRRAFFATRGFGRYPNWKEKPTGGERYTRTHAYVRGWQVRKKISKREATVIISHDDSRPGISGKAESVGQFIGGPYQQGFHRRTGWARYEPELQAIMILSEDWIRDAVDDLYKRLVQALVQP